MFAFSHGLIHSFLHLAQAFTLDVPANLGLHILERPNLPHTLQVSSFIQEGASTQPDNQDILLVDLPLRSYH